MSELPPYSKGAIQRAKNLRNNMTDAEWKLWGNIRNRQLGVRFRRQCPVGNYIVDFIALEVGLVIEIDGEHHYLKGQRKKDSERSEFLEGCGLEVLRFWNGEVIENIEGVVEKIKIMIEGLRR
jgi:very-short-patch-repair endonuclease|tara:strand:+ start:5107 stop:5475 length:369 start_codon:yes stop_codon:yes gene_type:complete